MQIGIQGGFFSRSIHTDVIDTFRLARSNEKEAVVAKAMSLWEVICDSFNDGNQRKALGLLFDIVQLEHANQDAKTSINEKIANTAMAKENFTAMKGLIKNGFTMDIMSSDEHQLRVFLNCPTKRRITVQEFELPIHFNETPGEFRSTFLYTSQGTADTTDDACRAFNALCNATSLEDKLQWLGALQQLDGEPNQDKYACKYVPASKKLFLLVYGLEIESMKPACDQETIARLCPEGLQFIDVERDAEQLAIKVDASGIGLEMEVDDASEIDLVTENDEALEIDLGLEVEDESDVNETSSDEEDDASLVLAAQLEIERLERSAQSGA